MVTGVSNISRTNAISAYGKGINTKNQTKANGSDQDFTKVMGKEEAVVYEPSAVGLKKSREVHQRSDGSGLENTLEDKGTVDAGSVEKSPEYQSQLQELANRENEVIMHEQAHMSAGGEFAGAASYSYTVGPDGKRYISGGEVSINTPSTDDPEEAVRIMERVKQAAMAPASPSGQDMRVAASASAKQMKAQSQIAAQRAEKAYGSLEDKGDVPFDLTI